LRKPGNQEWPSENEAVEVVDRVHQRGSAEQLRKLMTLDFHLRNNAGELSVASDFIVPYVPWGLKNPSTFLLKVSDKVQMHIERSNRLPGGELAPQLFRSSSAGLPTLKNCIAPRIANTARPR